MSSRRFIGVRWQNHDSPQPFDFAHGPELVEGRLKPFFFLLSERHD